MRHDLLLHPRTVEQAEAYLQNPAHALLVTGVAGSGKAAVARILAANLLAIEPEKLESYPYYSELSVPEGKQEIPIENIREMIEGLKLKAPGSAAVRRVVLIEDAASLSLESQNALLKTLEEPSAETVFILTAPAARNVAPTIVSRSQSISINPVDQAVAQAYYGTDFDNADISANWRLSGGAAGLLDALLKNEAQHPLKSAVSDFKDFLRADRYGRLVDSERLARDKVQLAYFLDAGNRVLRALQPAAGARLANIVKSRKLLMSLQKALDANANPRLVATALALNLKL